MEPLETGQCARHLFAQRSVPLANGRDKSGPYNTGNKLLFFDQKAVYIGKEMLL